HQARVAAHKVFAARLEGRDPAAEKREAKRRVVADRVEDLLETFIAQRLSQNRSGGEIARLLRREVGKTWGGRSIHEIGKRDVVEVVTAIAQRGAPVAANKALKATKTFLRWCVGRAVLDQSPAEGVPLPSKEIARHRVLDDNELARVILAARKMGGPYGGIVELLALTGQRREEVARLQWAELDLAERVWTLPKSRTKNAKAHVVHLSEQSMAVLAQADKPGPSVFSLLGTKPFQEFSRAKRRLDQLSGVTKSLPPRGTEKELPMSAIDAVGRLLCDLPAGVCAIASSEARDRGANHENLRGVGTVERFDIRRIQGRV